MAFILYKIPDASKYTTFSVPKSNGGTRTIHAPNVRLKRLQTRLAKALQDCNSEILAKQPQHPLSHGFEKGRSIFTNAWEHKSRRYVLNVDIEDFFPTINFGRVRGFLMSNRDFALPPKAATLIAQIACYQGKLPQGSPCSPIVANLIAHLLDVRMVRLAKANKCTYTRYADDLTFSTNQKHFPAALAEELADFPGSWVLSDIFLSEVARSGFAINHRKTRMQCRPSQQLVTGLTVNEKVNIRATYYRKARKMCSSLFNHGHYYTELVAPSAPAVAAASVLGAPLLPVPKLIKSTAPLEGILSHIYFIKHKQLVASDPDEESRKSKGNKTRYPAYRTLYRKFLYFRHFVNPPAPLIVCEGKTDNIYLRSALKGLNSYPQLAEVKVGKLFMKVSILKHSRVEHDILELSGGSGNIATLISRYNATFSSYRFRPMQFPIILLVDNDSGQKGNAAVFSEARKLTKAKIDFLTRNDFYHLCYNLYLVKTPELGTTGESCMEDLFDPSVLKMKLNGRIFNPKDNIDLKTEYGKFDLADKIIRPNYATIDFSQFRMIFDRILAVMAHYHTIKPATGP